jgi:hypothetical protein
MKQVMVALLIGAKASAALAASPGLLGFELGAQLSVDQCPKSAPGTPLPQRCIEVPTVTAWRDDRLADHHDAFIVADQRPTWANQVRVIARSGTVLEVTVATDGIASQAEALAALTKRLGAPTKVSRKEWYHRVHGRINSVSASWRGAGWEGIFESAVGGRTDAGLIMVHALPEKPQKPSAPL